MVCAWLCSCATASASGRDGDPYDAIAQGNAAFSAGRYEEAWATYQVAAEILGDTPELDYNRAAACYKMEQYGQAADLFERASMSPDVRLSRQARFNWGNCEYAAALEALQEVPTTDHKVPDLDTITSVLDLAVAHYRDALPHIGGPSRDAATEDAARANIERTQRLIDRIQEVRDCQPVAKEEQEAETEAGPTSNPEDCNYNDVRDVYELIVRGRLGLQQQLRSRRLRGDWAAGFQRRRINRKGRLRSLRSLHGRAERQPQPGR